MSKIPYRYLDPFALECPIRQKLTRIRESSRLTGINVIDVHYIKSDN